jgi:hypothetical protein
MKNEELKLPCYRNTKSLILLLTIFVLIAGCNSAQKQTGCSKCEDVNSVNSFDLLAGSKCFHVGGIGYAGVISPEEIALRGLMKQKNASAVLEELFSKSPPVGQLYAALGLRIINKAKYEKLIPQINQNNHKVLTQDGCLIFEKTIQEVVKSIDAGDYDFLIQRKLPSDGNESN